LLYDEVVGDYVLEIYELQLNYVSEKEVCLKDEEMKRKDEEIKRKDKEIEKKHEEIKKLKEEKEKKERLFQQQKPQSSSSSSFLSFPQQTPPLQEENENGFYLKFTLYIYILFSYLFYFFPSGMMTSLVDLMVPNRHGKFKLEGRNIKFQSGGFPNDKRSLILKEGISNGILEVFVLC
jgi:hypothetical protein